MISDLNMDVFKTKNVGYNNITIGYEEYTNKVQVTLEKTRQVDYEVKNSILGFPISYKDKEISIIKFYKQSEFLDKTKNYLPSLRPTDKTPMISIPLDINYN